MTRRINTLIVRSMALRHPAFLELGESTELHESFEHKLCETCRVSHSRHNKHHLTLTSKHL